MLNSKLTPPKPLAKYPKLMVNPAGKIVLFTSDGHGTVVSPVYGEIHKMGYRSRTWAMQNFTNYDGTVSLTNE